MASVFLIGCILIIELYIRDMRSIMSSMIFSVCVTSMDTFYLMTYGALSFALSIGTDIHSGRIHLYSFAELYALLITAILSLAILFIMAIILVPSRFDFIGDRACSILKSIYLRVIMRRRYQDCIYLFLNIFFAFHRQIRDPSSNIVFNLLFRRMCLYLVLQLEQETQCHSSRKHRIYSSQKMDYCNIIF
eukprot:731359_1